MENVTTNRFEDYLLEEFDTNLREVRELELLLIVGSIQVIIFLLCEVIL